MRRSLLRGAFDSRRVSARLSALWSVTLMLALLLFGARAQAEPQAPASAPSEVRPATSSAAGGSSSRAQPNDAMGAGTPGSGSASAEAAAEPTADPRVAKIRALTEGTLEVSVAPESLFDVSLSDDAAVKLEATRIRTLLRAANASKATNPAPPLGRARPAKSKTPDPGELANELQGVDRAAWERRLDLDRARLEFYALEPEQRQALLKAHAARQEMAKPRETAEQRRSRESELERQHALQAARNARTEAERLVGEELARLIALESHVNTVRQGFQDERDKLASRRDLVLGWQRRVRDAKGSISNDADATYDALRRTLLASRDDLAVAVEALNDDKTRVPSLGPDALVEVPEEVQTEQARERRSAVARAIAVARKEERSLLNERASRLLDEITVLNRERLGLLPHLTADKRDAITGFTGAGWDQARSEARHLSLILRYHHHAARTWLLSLRAGSSSAVPAWKVAVVAIPLVLTLGAFFWGRRRTPTLLQLIEARIVEAERPERRTSPSLLHRAVRVLSKTHRPLEWILLFGLVLWILPASAQGLLEFQLISAAVAWILASALIVNLINAFASGSAGTIAGFEDDPTGQLRLRSLRLVGRTVVVFALILVLSTRLAGQGTIYSWVFSTCWFAAIPIFLVLVRWWRGTVFERLDRARKKTPFQAWILANRSGWKSLLPAMLGALQLFGTGALRVVRGWISRFDLVRRVHAYLFKREIERLGEGKADARLFPLDPKVLEVLHPEQPFTRWISCPSDQVLESVERRVAERRGGLVALVGPRGMGKSSLLRVLRSKAKNPVSVNCQAGTPLSEIRSATLLDSPSPPQADLVLLDDAHALIRSSIGGLALFDELIALARGASRQSAWVFSLDASVWPLLKRARDARPLFDEICKLAPWNESQIGELLADRGQRAGFSPTYEDLLEELPPGADEIDRQDALKAKQAGYERMLWDHAGGNPALALEAWRSSLARDATDRVHVRSLRVPDLSTLENLPDSSLFILRAVLQFAPASVEAVASVTRMRPEEVLQDFHFGQTQGFFAEQDGSVRVTWPWLRTATRLLERRHLLVRS